MANVGAAVAPIGIGIPPMLRSGELAWDHPIAAIQLQYGDAEDLSMVYRCLWSTLWHLQHIGGGQSASLKYPS